MRTPVRVLHVVESGGWAGGEAWIARVAGAMHTRFDLAVAVPETGALIPRLDALGVPVWHVPRGQLISPRALVDLVRLFRSVAPAIVHSHGARSNVYTRLAARRAGVPGVVSTVHNSLFDYPVAPMRRRIYVALERVTSTIAHRILPVSRAIARDLVDRYRIDPARVTIVRNGIDADAFAAEAVASGPLDVFQRPLIGVVARMTEQKAHAVLLDALPLIRARVPGITCLMIGDGVLRSALEDRARALGVADACRFLGARTDVARLLATVDLAVLPSRSEGLPFAVLEAMAVGTPVVATNVGGVAEVVQDGVTGRLVRRGDAGALAAAIVSLLTDAGRSRAMGLAATRRVRTEFPLTGMVTAIEHVYDETLASGRHVLVERAR
jgi:glycosyltransferase involved in cell wall biosynthesis